MKLFTLHQEEMKWDLELNFNKKILFLLFTIVIPQTDSGDIYRRYGIHNGNQVRTVFSNYGVVGQPGDKGKIIIGNEQIDVLDTRCVNNEIIHVLENISNLSVDDEIECKIDW